MLLTYADVTAAAGCNDVKAFCEELARKGVTCELIFNGAIATITDPAGVTIEINSGLENR